MSKPFDTEAYWMEPPPAPSPGLLRWRERIRGGWRPNRRFKGMGYNDRAEFFRCYLWEYFNVLVPEMRAAWGELR